MKEEQTKALFFAQYLGQKVFKYNEYIQHVYELAGGHCHDEYLKRGYLLLRSVSQLMDEEHYQIAVLCGFLPDKYNRIEMEDLGHSMIAAFQEDFHISLQAHQYMLRVGIILPFTYLNETNTPVTLQPHEIIAMGWVKLLTD